MSDNINSRTGRRKKIEAERSKKKVEKDQKVQRISLKRFFLYLSSSDLPYLLAVQDCLPFMQVLHPISMKTY